ncbi:MAG: diguanylate cyclase [Gammaproteobacteria bacterium]|jgi:diguanylate cyclase (GGDEF)-like protein|nr:diguanylate cyclase [Gammaproteobacteria bacterium]MBT4492283.1 diguanylate cyclase [Gammaproteobacteria bacterium]
MNQSRILIVDDEALNLEILHEILADLYSVTRAVSGAEALEEAQKTLPDLILLDIEMPEIDGYEVCKHLKDDPLTQNIPIIFVTGRVEVDDETRGFDVGAVDYISKPYNPRIIRARVNTHLELKHHRDVLEELSSLDGLTGVANRRAFDERLSSEWNRATRTNSTLALVMVDVDFFKLYNDHYGHASGDDCLKQVAKALADSLQREYDFFARYGGEEFVAVLPGMEEKVLQQTIAKMCMTVEALKIPHAESTVADCVTISLGGAIVVPTRETSASELIVQADEMLYEAKEAGRNRGKTR